MKLCAHFWLSSPCCTAREFLLIASAVLKQRVCKDVTVSPLAPHLQVLMPTSGDGTVTTSKCLQYFSVPRSGSCILKVQLFKSHVLVNPNSLLPKLAFFGALQKATVLLRSTPSLCTPRRTAQGLTPAGSLRGRLTLPCREKRPVLGIGF